MLHLPRNLYSALGKCCACRKICKMLRLPRDLHLRNSLRGCAIGELSETVARPWRPCAKQGYPSRVSHVANSTFRTSEVLTKLPLANSICFTLSINSHDQECNLLKHRERKHPGYSSVIAAGMKYNPCHSHDIQHHYGLIQPNVVNNIRSLIRHL